MQESFSPERLTPIDLTSSIQRLQLHAATSIVNVHTCALRAFCTWLVDQGDVERNPVLRLKAIGTPKPLAPKALKLTQVNALLRAAQQTRHTAQDYALLQLMIQTGMRISECAALRLGDIQISERQGKSSSAPARVIRVARFR